MKASTQCINLIKKYEGCRLTAYKCPAGVWTIGYGHTKGVKKGDTITPLQAEQLLYADLEKYEKHVMAYDPKYHWNQFEFDALVSFAFNIGGIGQLTANGVRTREQIAKKMLEYVYAAGKRLTGLERRRKEEHDLFIKECASDNYVQAAKDVIDGKYGNGSERKTRLEAAGYDYKQVQTIVNRLLRST